MSPRARVVALVAAVAAAAAAIAVTAGLLGEEAAEPVGQPVETAQPLEGFPPLVLDFGLRTDVRARELWRATQLYRDGKVAEARRIFARDDSLEASVGEAFASWPDGTLARLEQLGGLYPRSAVVQLHLGLVRFWSRRAAAETAWRETEELAPDSPYAVTASTLLHRDLAPGLPLFVPSFELPRELAALPLREQFERLRGGTSARERILYGVALQQLGRPVSARRSFDAAVKLEPGNADALVAAAVARFDKDNPSLAFSRLGPLTNRLPREPSVRFHLGLLLIWTGRVDEARRQLRRARELGPESVTGREASRWLERLENVSAK